MNLEEIEKRFFHIGRSLRHSCEYKDGRRDAINGVEQRIEWPVLYSVSHQRYLAGYMEAHKSDKEILSLIMKEMEWIYT